MKLGKTSSRHRNPPLYNWLVLNYDRLKLEIGSAKDPDDLEFSRVRSQWIACLPSDYKGRRSTPLGVMMEWKRVVKEMGSRRVATDALRSDDVLSQVGE